MGVLKMESVFGVSSCFLESLFMRLSFFYGTIFHIADEIKNIKGGRNMDTNYKYYKEITGELVRVHIEQDTTPENPRYAWDGNIGHMMCWHRNYQLGDYKENSYSDNLDFLNNLLRARVSESTILNFVKNHRAANFLTLDYDRHAYINFTYLIESYMGNTSKNLQRVFDFCKGQKCVLMLDEIDCIGLKRENGKGCDGELARTTIALMQCLDNLVDGQVVIAATNRADRLDPALLRRFHNKKEFNRYNMEEELAMITQFVDCIDILEMDQDLVDYSTEGHTQAETMDFLTNKIAKTALEEIRKNKSNS